MSPLEFGINKQLLLEGKQSIDKIKDLKYKPTSVTKFD